MAKQSVEMSKRGAYLHNLRNGRKAGNHGDKKKKLSKKACRGRVR